MRKAQEPEDPSPLAAWLDAVDASLSALGWVDLTAMAVVLVFFILGFFRGLVWQLSRIAILLIAYFAAVTFGGDLSQITASWFDPIIETSLPLYLAVFLIFIGTLIVVSVIAHFVQKLVDDTGFSFANRVGGGICGTATGGLVVLACLTLVQMVNASYGIGAGVAHAARSSKSMQVSHTVLRNAERVAPKRWHEVMGRWLQLLGEEDVENQLGPGDLDKSDLEGTNGPGGGDGK